MDKNNLENLALELKGEPKKGDWFDQNLGGRKLEKKKEPGWLDKILGGLGNFARSDTGTQVLSGLLAQAVSDQSYGGQTFLSGMVGAKEDQQARAQTRAAAEQQAFENLMDVEDIGVEKQKNIADMLGVEVDAKEAATKADKYVLDKTKYTDEFRQTVAEKYGEGKFKKLKPKERLIAYKLAEGGIYGDVAGTWWGGDPPHLKVEGVDLSKFKIK